MAFARKGRQSKFNVQVLNEIDSNGDVISVWCRQGIKQEEAFCTICNTVINCAQHGVAAVKRHAANKSHVELCTQHRDASGVLKKPATKQVQLESCFSTGPGLSEADRAARADTYFALGVALSGIPYTYGDAATKMMPLMFPDSKIAKEFQCGRKKLSYIISDGLGPYFKKAVTDELNKPHTYYTIQIDETPLPEQRCQQLDVMARYFSDSQKRVVVKHLRSYHLGSATSGVLLAHVKEALQDLPARNMLCFYSDGPNVMRSLKKRLKEDVNPALLDISECSLHKVHNAFAKGLEAFGDTVETTLLDIYHFFKNSAVQSATLKATQRFLGLPENVLLRHVSSRWLTLSSALDRFIQQHEAVKETVLGAQQKSRAGGNIYRRLKEKLMKKDLLPKAIFLRNVADVFVEFLTLFQRREPLLHILYEEMVKLVKRILGRFLLIGAYRDFTGVELQSLNVECSANWKQVVEIGADTENSINSFTPEEKKMFRLGARSFYIQVAKYLLSRLPPPLAIRCLKISRAFIQVLSRRRVPLWHSGIWHNKCQKWYHRRKCLL
ncbi:uncharacterized protein LOC119400398 [Rhipicephalus sanguineus]|uniref:uncharacterized protein LOC119400398 n=1 Tax=Rhipicephalus sanguineus TaxID=34632 RepID=UPI0018948B07|nr:uncharacterized protein LOC119400398 [Rhipicephalus sanguineus]